MKRVPYSEREREAVIAFAMSVALDPSAHPDDVCAARERIAGGLRPSELAPGFVQGLEPWQVFTLRAVLAPESDERTDVRATRERIRSAVTSDTYYAPSAPPSYREHAPASAAEVEAPPTKPRKRYITIGREPKPAPRSKPEWDF